MAAVGLLFVGAVLFVNGLLLLGLVDAKSAAPFNLFVGALQTAVPFYLIATAKTADDILLASGIFLFGFTYLYVGITNLAGYSTLGVGWYSLWVVILAVAFSLTNFFKFDDTKFGVIWLHWALLWGLFWLVLGLGIARLTQFTGWVALIMSFTTCTVPAFLILLGEWDPIKGYWAIVVAGVEALLFAVLWTRSVGPAPATTGAEPTTARPVT
jgi:putative amide transporter protein